MTSIVHSRRLLPGEDAAPVLRDLADSVGLSRLVKPGDLVLLKPNYVAPFPIATTDFAFLEFFIDAVRSLGATPVVGEMSGYEFDTESTVQILGVRPFLDRHNVRFVNFEKAAYRPLDIGPDLRAVSVAEIALDADFIINLPVLKGHTITKVTGATKNFFGVLGRDSRRRLHCHGLHKGIAALARAFPRSLHVVDARNLLTRAVFGESNSLGYCLAGTDSFALDHFGCRLLGIDPDSVEHLASAPGGYEVDGPVPEDIALSEKASFKERFHRFMYSCFYYMDECKSRFIGGDSLIPHLHWVLGVHPDVGAVPSDRLEEVAALCPVRAISVRERRVIKERCLTVRCLRCYSQDPTGTVVLKGLNPPKKRN